MEKKNFVVSSSLDFLIPEKNENLLFYGNWCFTNLKKNIEKKKFQILDYHWDDQKKLEKDHTYIKKIYGILSKDLAVFLNQTHKKNFSKRYWEQLFGIWLIRFIIFTFDKYSTVRKLSKKKKYSYYYVDLKNKLTPNTSSEANFLFQDEYYNHKIFTDISLQLRPNIIFIEKKIPDIRSSFSNAKLNFSFSLNLLSFLFKKVKKKNEIFIISSYLGLFKEILLQLKINGFPKFNFCKKIEKKFQISNFLRGKKITNKKDDNFLKLIKSILIKNIPASYLEGYDYILKKSLFYGWPNAPKAIFTTNIHFNYDVFKVWLASKRENKAKLVVGQHGAGYTFSKFHSDYDLDVNNCDNFISWGKKKYKNKKIFQGFNFRTKKKFVRNNKKNILLVQHFPYKYTTRLVSNDHNFSNINKNIKMQKLFIKNLNNKITSSVKIRLFSSENFYPDIHNYEKDQWYNLKKKYVFETRKVPIERSINNAKIVIINTIHSTLFFECLSSNIPCVLFSSFPLNTILMECREDFADLKKIGIIQDDPLKFSKFLNKKINFIDEWWNEKKILKIKNKFIKNYCYFENNTVKEIKNKLISFNL